MATGMATACGLLEERRNHGMPDGGVDGKKGIYSTVRWWWWQQGYCDDDDVDDDKKSLLKSEALQRASKH